MVQYFENFYFRSIFKSILINRSLIDELQEQLSVLIIDQFGNYVVQHILEHCPEDRDVIIKYMCAQIFPMSKHKFASNVAERCLLSANEEQKSALIEAFLYSSQGSEPENITSVNASSSTVFMVIFFFFTKFFSLTNYHKTN